MLPSALAASVLLADVTAADQTPGAGVMSPENPGYPERDGARSWPRGPAEGMDR